MYLSRVGLKNAEQGSPRTRIGKTGLHNHQNQPQSHGSNYKTVAFINKVMVLLHVRPLEKTLILHLVCQVQMLVLSLNRKSLVLLFSVLDADKFASLQGMTKND